MPYINIIFLVVGLVAMIKGSDIFVDGSAGIAKNLKVPPVVIGLTIMAFGTSAPEAVIGISSAISGTGELSVANAIGSNIFNLIFIIGACALVKPMHVIFSTIATDFWVTLSGPILLLVSAITFRSQIPRFIFLLMLTFFLIYVYLITNKALRYPTSDVDDSTSYTIKRNLMYTILGLVFIIGGGEITVRNAVSIATSIGVSARIVGLTILSVGTSLPELIISFTASKKGENGLALGNIIGSSSFNIFFVLGISGLISPFVLTTPEMLDLAILTALSIVFLIFVLTRKKIDRFEGLTLVILYLAYMMYLTFFS